jgi:hypothetical protein
VARVRPALTVLAGIVVLAVAGCGGAGGDSDSAPPPSAQDESSPVRDLETLEPLKQDFNADSGRSRLLLILSPT